MFGCTSTAVKAECRCLVAGACVLALPGLMAQSQKRATPVVITTVAPQVRPAALPVVISGEETLEPALLMAADELQAIQPGFKYDFQSTVSEHSIKALCEGSAAVAAITRDIKPDEVAAFTARWGYAPTRISFAMDALVILVNKDNPVRQIKMEQLDAAWSSERRQGWPAAINTWGELGVVDSAWSSRPLVLVGHPGGSDARELFTQKVTLGAASRLSVNHPATIMGMVEMIENDASAMGYTSLGAVFNKTRGVAVVPLGEASGVEPTPENVENGTYPLSRSVSFYINKPQGRPADPRVLQFLRYVLSPAGQRGLKLNGFAGLDPGVIAANLRRLD